jgi:hypothetical protein
MRMPILIYVLLPFFGLAQNGSTKSDCSLDSAVCHNDLVVRYPEKHAEFVEGNTKLFKVLSDSCQFKYEHNGSIHSKLYISILIDENGNALAIKQMLSRKNSVIPAYSKTFLQSLKFEPAECFGDKVKSEFLLPVYIYLD